MTDTDLNEVSDENTPIIYELAKEFFGEYLNGIEGLTEIRDGKAWDCLKGASSGHEGNVTTLYEKSPKAAISGESISGIWLMISSH